MYAGKRVKVIKDKYNAQKVRILFSLLLKENANIHKNRAVAQSWCRLRLYEKPARM